MGSGRSQFSSQLNEIEVTAIFVPLPKQLMKSNFQERGAGELAVGLGLELREQFVGRLWHMVCGQSIVEAAGRQAG